MANFMKGGSAGTQERTKVHEEITVSHDLGHITNISVGRDRERSSFISRDILDVIGDLSEYGGNLVDSSNIIGESVSA